MDIRRVLALTMMRPSQKQPLSPPRLSSYSLIWNDTTLGDRDRLTAWLEYEVEAWYEAVHSGRLQLCQLEARMQPPVYDLICRRGIIPA